jgi:CcmD family protein
VDFLSQNALYVVLLIVLVVWLGVFLYLSRIDKRLKVLEDVYKKASQ